MIAVNVLEDLVTKKGIPLYIEHNDFMNGGIDIDEEVDELLHNYHIDMLTADQIKEAGSVWSIRYYYEAENFELFYDATLEGVIGKLLHKLES